MATVVAQRRSKSKPRMRVMTIAAAVLLSSLGGPASADDGLHKRKQRLSAAIRSAQNQSAESSRALSEATARLEAVRGRLSRAQDVLSRAQGDLADAAQADAAAKGRLQAAQADLDDARRDVVSTQNMVTRQRADIGALAASNYAYGDPALLGVSVMLTSRSPEEATTQLNTVSALMSRETFMLSTLKRSEARARAERARSEQLTLVVAARARDAGATLEKRQAVERVAAAAATRLNDLVVQQKTVEAVAARAMRADLAQLRALRAQDAALRRLILRRAKRQGWGYRGATDSLFYRPVPGWVTSPYGWRTHPIYGYKSFHDGVDFHAPCGSPVRALGDGTVIARVWSNVYGNRMYVDLGQVNGKAMTAVFNHLQSYDATVGPRVRRGQSVATAGNTGWSTGCHLHLTLLVDGAAVDPMPYL